ncbi:MAG: tryptophan synthase subunit alpha [Halieaceae bacterium]|nr:tryptophan synthase subunit alpha [Halieaceae bacterium]
MSRIKARFEGLRSSGRKALIPYLVAGDPQPRLTVPLMHRLVGVGADIIELGVPFSDPMAEGPSIQQGHERALANGVSLRSVLAMVEEFRTRDQTTPVLLMGYTNPLERMGFAEFTDAAVAAGLDALLTVDMPPEEVGPLNEHLRRAGLDNIFLLAPTTAEARIETISRAATGFLYYVSLKGVTGAGHLDTGAVADRLARIRRCSELPVAVGFGIKDAHSARAIAEVADGVVLGSTLVQLLADTAETESEAVQLDAAAGLIATIRAGIDGADMGQ